LRVSVPWVASLPEQTGGQRLVNRAEQKISERFTSSRSNIAGA
jgi:hypothetical protein